MRIGVVGNGVVGRATVRTWLEHCEEVRVYDADPRRSTCTLEATVDAQEVDLVFVCLPEDALDQFFAMQGMVFRNSQSYVLRSTVPIGTTRRLAKEYKLANIVHYPEFLTERCSLTDALCPARSIVGEPSEKFHMTSSAAADDYEKEWESCGSALVGMLKARFPGIPIHVMPSCESEAVKLMTNAFFSTKVAFFNEMYALCDGLGLSWDTVRAGVLSDGRIAHSHTQVPGPDGEVGFGGKCLPKDLKQLLKTFFEARVTPHMLLAANSYARE